MTSLFNRKGGASSSHQRKVLSRGDDDDDAGFGIGVVVLVADAVVSCTVSGGLRKRRTTVRKASTSLVLVTTEINIKINSAVAAVMIISESVGSMRVLFQNCERDPSSKASIAYAKVQSQSRLAPMNSDEKYRVSAIVDK